MDLRTLLINEHGRLRSGFRLLIFAVVFIFFSILLTEAARLAYAMLQNVFPSLPFASFFQNLFFRSALLATALIPGYLCTRFLEELPWSALGLTLHNHWIRDLVVGSLVGIGSISFAVGIAATGGGLNFSINAVNSPAQILSSVVASGVLFIIAALAEEAIFRGYPLQTLARAQLAALGILLTSFGFASAHLFNPNFVPRLSFLNTVLAGIWLGVAYLRTRSLWFPLGLHWVWNWALGSLFGLPVSGLKLVSAPLMKASDIGPVWLTGGSYGLEGGVAGTVALIVSTLFIWKMRFVSATPEMLKLTSEEKAVTQTESTT